MMNLQSTKLLLQRSKVDVGLIEKKKKSESESLGDAGRCFARQYEYK